MTLVLHVRLFCSSIESILSVSDINMISLLKCITCMLFHDRSDEQFLLKRLADASMDIYAMASVLSRY